MSGFTGFTKEAYSGLSNFESGFNSLARSVEQDKAGKRLVESQKFQLKEAYKADLQDFLQSLPLDTDQESYQTKAAEFTQSWRSRINEGNYDRQTLSWINSEFLPSRKAPMEGAVDIARDISKDVQTAAYARNFATLKGSDRSLSYEQAVSEYSAYHEKLGLSEVPLEFGIQSPDDFARSILAAKTLQAFQNEADRRIGDIDWDTGKAVSREIGRHSDLLTPDEKTGITNSAYQYAAQEDSRRTLRAREEAFRFNMALDEAIANRQYCDPEEIRAYIENIPYRYSLEARAVKNRMEAYNDAITSNLQRKAYLSKGTLTGTDILKSFKDESLAVEIMTEQLKGQAYKLYRTGYTAAQAYEAVGSSDFWPDFDDALVKQAKLFAQAQLASELQSQLTAEKRIAAADGVKKASRTEPSKAVTGTGSPGNGKEVFPVAPAQKESRQIPDGLQAFEVHPSPSFALDAGQEEFDASSDIAMGLSGSGYAVGSDHVGLTTTDPPSTMASVVPSKDSDGPYDEGFQTTDLPDPIAPSVGHKDAVQPLDLPVLPLLNEQELVALQELQSEEATLGNLGKNTVKTANPVILDLFAAREVARWGLRIVEEKGLDEAFNAIGTIGGLGSVMEQGGESRETEHGLVELTDQALGYAATMLVQEVARQEEEAKAARRDAALARLAVLRTDRYYAAHPEELKEKVNEFVIQGLITSEEGSKNSSVFNFVTAGTYHAIMSQVKTLAKAWGNTEAERNRIESQLDLWLANEFTENPGLYDDTAAAESIQKRLVDFSAKEFGNKQLKTIKELTTKLESQDGRNLLKSLRDGSTRDLLNKMAAGDLDVFINNAAQTNLALTRNGENAFHWIHYDLGQLRDFFSKQLGFVDRYSDLPDNAGGTYLKYVVEANVAYARTKAAVIRSFADTFTRLNQQPADLQQVDAMWVGDTWAIGDPEVAGLFWTPDLSVSRKPGWVDWSWGTMRTKEDGKPDVYSFKRKGSLSGFIPDSDSRVKMSTLEESIANNSKRLQEGSLPRLEHLKTKGFTARDSEELERLGSRYDEFFRQVFHARTAFGQEGY